MKYEKLIDNTIDFFEDFYDEGGPEEILNLIEEDEFVEFLGNKDYEKNNLKLLLLLASKYEHYDIEENITNYAKENNLDLEADEPKKKKKFGFGFGKIKKLIRPQNHNF